jgi:hypothetical protein
MTEPKPNNNNTDLLHASNTLYIKSNSNCDKNISSFASKKLNERNIFYLNNNQCLTSSISSNILLNSNNTFSNDLQYNNSNLNDINKDDSNIINNIDTHNQNDILNTLDKNEKSNLKKMVYHKKPLNNFYKNNNMNKSKKDINELINEKIDNICKNIKDSNNIINFNNKDYLIKLQQNEKMNEFKDFTLSEYLKEQIQNIEPNKLLDNTKNTNSHNYNSHEETNVNTLGTFTGKSKEKQLKCSKKNLKKNNSIKHMINHNLNNYITYNNYINSSLNYSTNNCKDKNKKKIIII